MLLFLISWMLLTASAAIVGSAVLAAVKFPVFRHFGDRIIIAIWLGLLTFAVTLLGLSIFLPLRPGISFALLAMLTGLAACSKSARDLLKIPANCRPNSAIAGIGILAAIVALDSTRLVRAFDTGLYHYQLVRWLSEYGTVPGLALLHFRFGFTSSWFALAAPFDFGPFQGRISGLLGGLAIFLALLHFALAVLPNYSAPGRKGGLVSGRGISADFRGLFHLGLRGFVVSRRPRLDSNVAPWVVNVTCRPS